MKITTTPKATRRTITRVKQHGPEFEIRQNTRYVSINGREVLCYLCDAPDGWLGWLPVDEIVISEEK